MQVAQATFTSLPGPTAPGYRLVARSHDIDDALMQALIRWGPSHGSLVERDTDAEAISYFAASADWFVLMRSVYGGPEYSDRGGLQVVTRSLALRPDQLAAYDWDPLLVVRTARILGGLRLQDPAAPLVPFELPDRPLDAWTNKPPQPPPQDEQLEEIALWLHQRQRVAVLGSVDPCRDLAHLWKRMTVHERKWVSFTTGLRPSAQRNFRLHMLRTREPQIRSALIAEGVTAVARVASPLPA